MNNYFSYDRCAAARVPTRKGSRSAMLAMAAACLLAPFSAGCQMGGSASAVHHPAFDQLEQGCFGYEPTVWRNMAGDCQQVVRMIPDDVVREPATVARPVPAEVTTPPTDVAVPEEPILDEVPDDRGPLDMPRIVAPPEEMPLDAAPPAETPPAEVPPAVSPSAVPEVPPADATPEQPAVEPAPVEPAPAAETPAAEPVPPAAEPATTETTEPPISAVGPQFAPIINGPVIGGPFIQTSSSNSQASADALFRTISQALDESSRPQRIAKRPAAANNLSRFISY